MTHDTNDIANDDADDTHSLATTRRGLMRATAAGAGATAAGAGIPAVTDIDPAIGRGRAIAPAIPILAAGAVGVAAAGAALYLREDGDEVEAEDVSAEADRQMIYSAAESAIIAQKSAIRKYAAEVGVGKSDTDQVVWVNQQSNSHRSQMIEHATAEAALAWDDGLSRSQAQLAARNAARSVSVSSEVSLVSLHNSLVGALSKSLLRAQQRPPDDPVLTIDGNRPVAIDLSNERQNLAKTAAGWGEYPDYGTFVQWSGADWKFSSQPGVVKSRSYLQDIPEPSEYLSGSDIQESYPVFVAASRSGILSPFNSESVSHMAADEHDTLTKASTSGAATTIRASHDGNSAELNMRWITESMRAIHEMRTDVVSNMDEFSGKVYDSLQSGEITVSDVVSGRQLYQDLQPSEEVSRRSVTLAAAGADGAIDRTVTIAVGNRTLTGALFVEGDPLEVTPGQTLSGGDYERIHLITDAGRRETWTDADITIEAIDGSDSGSLEFDPARHLSADANAVTGEEIRKVVKKDQERYQQLKEQIEQLEAQQQSPLTGLVGAGGDNRGLIVGGAAALLAFLLGSSS
ncbi:hypothetical protein [Halorubrum ezzemoulense]|uniref:Envelope protein N-terminal domain-containing protein n=1 Tax=Halorubrum ezzemoulense TaxID=337243 RepID=A0A256JUQ8_HALEZ|nr:hypothetical protein [Halorubrum ezzemoulense]OYR72353.1 hypothetical protein DJ78_03090 [Halorubrum ezzemoulense]